MRGAWGSTSGTDAQNQNSTPDEREDNETGRKNINGLVRRQQDVLFRHCNQCTHSCLPEIPKIMKLLLPASALALFIAASLMAQSVPAGWKQRIDKSTNASDPDAAGTVKIVTAGKGFHVETPTAAVFWNPANTVTGNYTLKGTFTLNKPSGHTNYYGLIFGGSALEGAEQKYTYFMVAQNGAWLIKTRNGTATTATFPGLTGASRNGAVMNEAVKKPDASGKSVNTLEVRVHADKIDFVVNGTVVHSAPKAGVVTDGIWGFRSNHMLDVDVEGLGVSKGK
jgi:hypothetical protein